MTREASTGPYKKKREPVLYLTKIAANRFLSRLLSLSSEFRDYVISLYLLCTSL